MSIKQKIHHFGSIASLFIGIGITFIISSPAYAYTCAYSGPNNNGMKDQYALKMEGDGGSCYYMQPDKMDNSKKQQVFSNGQPTGKYECVDGTVKNDDGNCWTYKKTFTSYQPTFDDGSTISNDAFQAACQQQGAYYGSHYNYDSKLNACSAGFGCIDSMTDEGVGRSYSGGTGLPVLGDCRRVGFGTKTAGDILGTDPTTAKVQQCLDLKIGFNKDTKECNWTKETCEVKNNGQGLWIDGQCKSYTDFASETECKKIGGAWQQDPNDAKHWECNKPGTEVNSNKEPEAERVKGSLLPVTGKCGKARTNLISCSEKSEDAFNDVLRIILLVLTTLVGIGAVGGLAWASVLYAKAEDNQSQVQEARELIRNVIIGILVYGFLLAIVGWLIPGSVIG